MNNVCFLYLSTTGSIPRTVMVVEVERDPLREAVQVYCPASDGAISLSERSLESAPPVMAESCTPGPSHWKTGVPVTPLGREMEQVRVTESPVRMGEEGEVRKMVAGTVREILYVTLNHKGIYIPIVASSPAALLGNVLELAETLM